jgi:hypothetical protein
MENKDNIQIEIEQLQSTVDNLKGVINSYDSKGDLKYCETHESAWMPFESSSEPKCPWCQRDQLFDEIEMIKEIFESAIAARETKGGQQVPYHGDFANITPSIARDMKFWIERWNKLLPKEYEP